MDPNTAYRGFIVSDDNRRVTFMPVNQAYPDHPERFTLYPQVLSREPLPGCRYFEVDSRGKGVAIAVCYKDMNREEMLLSLFGYNELSWVLSYFESIDGTRLQFCHNSIGRAVSVPASSTGSIRWGVYVDNPAGVLSFYSVDVDTNTMSLLHTERTTFTKPLYAGIMVMVATAEVCKIW